MVAMSNTTRRAVLGLTGGALASLAGCSATGSTEDCSPASFPEGTETREEPPEPCQFAAELKQAGLEMDRQSTVSLGAGDAGVFYYHRPERHREDIRTIALELVPYRRMISDGQILTYTALETSTDRHGTGHIAGEWADSYAGGSLTESEYVEMAVDTYGQR